MDADDTIEIRNPVLDLTDRGDVVRHTLCETCKGEDEESFNINIVWSTFSPPPEELTEDPR